MGIALDANGNAWVIGSTQSPDFPVTPDALQPKFGGGLFDGYLARCNPSGGLDYATYIGGAGYNTLNATGLDGSGNIYVTGESGGLSQPASSGAFQPQANSFCAVFGFGPSESYPQGNALVAKFDPKAHSILGLTYLGAPFCLSGTFDCRRFRGRAVVCRHLGPSRRRAPHRQPSGNRNRAGIH
jgi:hypothetical protein